MKSEQVSSPVCSLWAALSAEDEEETAHNEEKQTFLLIFEKELQLN